MVEEVSPNIYRIQIPLPRSPLKYLNSYLIKGSGRSLLVDAGMNRQECLDAMLAGLRELAVDLARTDIFVTHLHSDHIGLSGELATGSSRVYFGRAEAAIERVSSLEKGAGFQAIFNRFLSSGFPERELAAAFENHPGRKYDIKRDISFSLVDDGDILEVGDYAFRCVETPGHTPGHMCLLEADKKILLAGDQILFDITPNITFWPQLRDSLGDYLSGLDKIYRLDVDVVLPGHRRILKDHRRRIEELREHHRLRLEEVKGTLVGGARNAYDVASRITWDIATKSWEDFPLQQKWFAVGETISHLEHLEALGQVGRHQSDGQVTFTLS